MKCYEMSHDNAVFNFAEYAIIDLFWKHKLVTRRI